MQRINRARSAQDVVPGLPCATRVPTQTPTPSRPNSSPDPPPRPSRPRCPGASAGSGIRSPPSAATAWRPAKHAFAADIRRPVCRAGGLRHPLHSCRCNTRLVDAAMALAIGCGAAAHTRAHLGSSPRTSDPKPGVSTQPVEEAGDTHPRRAWVLMPLRRPAREREAMRSRAGCRPSAPRPYPRS